MPSIGRLTRYRPPQGPGVRVDTGVYEGAEISMFYDPMIAKLVTFGASREAAIHRMAGALDAFQIRGLNHNIGFLAAIMGRSASMTASSRPTSSRPNFPMASTARS
ncbi:MAG: hypothetical protein WDN69_08240 [Aliidongia sp.]